MTVHTYKEITSKAQTIKTNVEKTYVIGLTLKWGYYFAKAITTPNKDITILTIKDPSGPTGTSISQQIVKADYLDMAKRIVAYVEKNKQIPNYVTYKTYKISAPLYTYIFAKIIVWMNNNKNTYPNYVETNSKVFTKPTETGNTVYDYFVQKTGKKYTTIDDLLEYVRKNFKYEFYYDDHKSNKQVTDSKAGNCTDLLQWLWNMAKAMGYDCKCIHVQCRVSGVGHVRGQFKHSKNTNGKWINRDIAAVADGGSVTSLWCADGYKLAENPSWFMQNLNR